MAEEAYAMSRTFPAAPRQRFQVPKHYILYCATGVLRLEADHRVWSLPPARAAVIRADEAVHVTLPRPVAACSVLLSPAFVDAPEAPLAVIDMSPLARELILACGAYDQNAALDPYGSQLFRMLAAEVYRLAQRPSRAVMPTPRSTEIERAIEFTESRLAATPVFEDVAAAVAMTPRTLARRFADEMGMTWREILRRLRMFRATELLATEDDNITAIALSTGYQSLSAFNAAFRDFAGETPTQYRRRLRSVPVPESPA